MVALDRNDGDFFLAGGWDGFNELDRAFIHRNNAWVEMTQMQTARMGKKSNLEAHAHRGYTKWLFLDCRPDVRPCQGKSWR